MLPKVSVGRYANDGLGWSTNILPKERRWCQTLAGRHSQAHTGTDQRHSGELRTRGNNLLQCADETLRTCTAPHIVIIDETARGRAKTGELSIQHHYAALSHPCGGPLRLV